MTKNNGSIILLLLVAVSLIALAAISAAGYFYLQTQKMAPTPRPGPRQYVVNDPITMNSLKDWKIYTNNKYKYTFSYQDNPNIELSTCSDSAAQTSGEDTVYFDSKTSTFPKCGWGGYSPPIMIVSQKYYGCDSDQNYSLDKQNITVAGQQTVKCIKKLIGHPEGPYAQYLQTVALRNSDGKTIVLILSQQNFGPIFDQILSTFKFTTTDTNLKTFTSSNLGFSIQVPQNEIVTQSNQNPDFKFVSIDRLHLIISNSAPQIGDPIFAKQAKSQDIKLLNGITIQLVLSQRGNTAYEKDGLSNTDEIAVAKNAAFTSKYWVDAKVPKSESEADFADIAQILATFKFL